MAMDTSLLDDMVFSGKKCYIIRHVHVSVKLTHIHVQNMEAIKNTKEVSFLNFDIDLVILTKLTNLPGIKLKST